MRELETQRDEAQLRFQELEVKALELEEDLAVGRALFQKLGDLLQSWHPKSSNSITDASTGEA
jgi:hypothetical protein